MAFIEIGTVASPHATPYDEDYPTRSTENLNHALHTILKAMDTQGAWYLVDNYPTSSDLATFVTWIRGMVKDVFDYADSAITNHRLDLPPGLSEPTTGMFTAFTGKKYSTWMTEVIRTNVECMAMAYKIYYMWMTEEDPLLLKEKLREILLAWPLTDMEINLGDDMGQQLKIIPVWKNIDL